MAMAVGMSACGEPKYGDDIAMKQIATGLEKRFDLRDQQIRNDTQDEDDSYRKAAQVELDNDDYLRTKPFRDLTMQSEVVSYLDTVKDSKKAIDSGKNDWSVYRDKRIKMLKKFVTKYKLQVNAKYADAFNTLITRGKYVTDDALEAGNKLLAKAQFKKTDCDNSDYCYCAEVKNTTKYVYYDINRKFTPDTPVSSHGIVSNAWYSGYKSWYPGKTMELLVGCDEPIDPTHITIQLWGFEIGDPAK